MKFEPLKTRPVQRLGFYFGILLIQVVHCRCEIRAVKNSSDVFVVCLVGFYCDVRPLLFYCREMYGFIEIFSGLWVIPWYVTTVVQIALWSKIDLSFSNLFSLISGILFNGILLIWFCFFCRLRKSIFMVSLWGMKILIHFLWSVTGEIHQWKTIFRIFFFRKTIIRFMWIY